MSRTKTMISSLEAWFNTRPPFLPEKPMPAPRPGTVAAARAEDGSAEVRIVKRHDGLLTFEIEAGANFEDAGGGAHVAWHTFYPSGAVMTDELERVIEFATLDASMRGLKLEPFEAVPRPTAG